MFNKYFANLQLVMDLRKPMNTMHETYKNDNLGAYAIGRALMQAHLDVVMTAVAGQNVDITTKLVTRE